MREPTVKMRMGTAKQLGEGVGPIEGGESGPKRNRQKLSLTTNDALSLNFRQTTHLVHTVFTLLPFSNSLSSKAE
jgi:hypothetical protein